MASIPGQREPDHACAASAFTEPMIWFRSEPRSSLVLASTFVTAEVDGGVADAGGVGALGRQQAAEHEAAAHSGALLLAQFLGDFEVLDFHDMTPWGVVGLRVHGNTGLP